MYYIYPSYVDYFRQNGLFKQPRVAQIESRQTTGRTSWTFGQFDDWLPQKPKFKLTVFIVSGAI